MAQLNWNKPELRKGGKAYGTGIVAGTNTTWKWGNTHRWKSIYRMPTDYLFFVAEKWNPGKARDMADKELLRRFDDK